MSSNNPLKVGDIAVVISSRIPEKVGMLCTVLNLKMRKGRTGLQALVEFPRPVVWLKTPKAGYDPRQGWMRACRLRPIRDSDKEDETLTRVGKPCDTLGRILESTPKVPVYVET